MFVGLGVHLFLDPAREAASDVPVFVCPGQPQVGPEAIQAIDAAVRRRSDEFILEHGIGDRIAAVLHSHVAKASVRNNVERAGLLVDPSAADQVAAHISSQRQQVVQGLAKLLDWQLALSFEASVFEAWDQTWNEIEAQVPAAARPQRSLGERIASPSRKTRRSRER